MNLKPSVLMLCGLPGSGKTTYAKKFEKRNVIRLSLDEELFKKFGRDFPSEKYQDFEYQTKKYLLEKLLPPYLRDGKSVILDWGFWSKKERRDIGQLIVGHGGVPRIIYFKKDVKDLEKNIQGRDYTTNHNINQEMLRVFISQFEEPRSDEDPIVI